jgi:hypothetical protein
MNTTTIDKSAIVASARARFTVRFPDRSPVGRCVHLSGCMIEELAERGIKGVFQAGSCYWPRLTPEQFKAAPEDVAPWFGYQWEPKSPQSLEAMAQGNLPEMHAWVGIVATQEIVDISCWYFPEVLAGNFVGTTLDDNKNKIGPLGWPGVKPPEFLWCRAGEGPDRVLYRAMPEPSILAAHVWSRVKEGVCR